MLPQLSFGPFDERFLEKSWDWLQDPEIKRLTMTPDFTREEQLRWFGRLPELADYLIWGISCDGIPVGAVGLKHITKHEAEYWGYLGERSYWSKGLGRDMIRFVLGKARELNLNELYLKVHCDNQRAIRLYTRAGFANETASEDVLQFRISLHEHRV